MSRVTGPCRLSIASTSPGSSATGSVERGHQPPSSSVCRDPADPRRSRGVDGGDVDTMVIRSVVVFSMTAFSSWNAEGAGGRREDADGRDLRSVGGRHLDTTPVRRDRDGRGSTMVLVRLNPGRRRTDARSGYEYGEDVARDPGSPSRRPAHEGVTMSDKSPRKGN